jgi:threonine dehydrogenase-like Zn-dependent dehydrogenase
MRAVRADGSGTEGGVTVVQVDAVDPGAPPPGIDDPVRVRVAACGICGSDQKLAAWNLPATLGHEFAGFLDDGTAVTVRPDVWCGECDRCRAGDTELCRTSGARLHGVSIDGGLADEVLVDRRCLVSLPAGLRPVDAALVEPLSVGLHAANRVLPEHPGRVCIVGGAAIGLAVAAAFGAAGMDVDLEARHERQWQAAEMIGAGRGGSGEYDVVVDAAGTQSALDRAVELVRPGGTIVEAGSWWAPVQLGTAFLMKEIRLLPATMTGHVHGEREFDRSVTLLAARPELVDAIVTHRLGLDDAAEAFRVGADRAAGAIKVVVEP